METNNIDFLDTKLKFSCACKGIRTCKICLSEGKIDVLKSDRSNSKPILDLSDEDIYQKYYPGIVIFRDFINPEEEQKILEGIQNLEAEFKESQSGRRKIDYGVKVNFKKQKVKLDSNFQGFPIFFKGKLEENIPIFIDSILTCVSQLNSSGSYNIRFSIFLSLNLIAFNLNH